MKFWQVTTTFDDKGHCTAAITSEVEADNAPLSSFTHTSRRDIYSDWFDSFDEAKAFADEAKNA